MGIVVTGAAGFIGSYICERLLGEGKAQIIGIDSLEAGKMENLAACMKKKKFSFRKQDCRDIDGNGWKEDIGEIYHFAASKKVREGEEKPQEYERNNVGATKNMLEFARRKDVKKFVFASTSTVYGDAKVVPTPEGSPLNPISVYGRTKVAGEELCQKYCQEYEIHMVVLRYANIYGERSDNGLIYDMYNKIRQDGNKLHVLGDGTQRKGYMYIEDAISATMAASEKTEEKFSVWNIGTADSYTVREMVQKICAVMNAKPEIEYERQREGWKGDVTNVQLSVEKIGKLGFRAKYSIDEGMDRYIRWLGRQ